MKYIKGDIRPYLTTKEFDAVVCTTNKTLKNNGELVMGAGIAKVFKEEYPLLPREWGNQLKGWGKASTIFSLMATPTLSISNIDGPFLIAFPTKNHWKDGSSPVLIKQSMAELRLIMYVLNFSSVLLPKPGCQNGGLQWDFIKQMLKEDFDCLGDRITIIDR